MANQYTQNHLLVEVKEVAYTKDKKKYSKICSLDQ